MEVLIRVLLGVNVILVEVTVHVNVSETVFQLGVVVIRNRSERIEQIGVNLGGLWHGIPLLFLRLILAVLHVGLHNIEVDTNDARVSQQVKAIAHATKET